MRTKKQYENTARIQSNLALFNETKDSSFLFNCYNDLFHAVKSMMIKRSKGYIYPGIDEKADLITLEWMMDIQKRVKDGKYVEITSPASMAYFKVIRYNPQDDGVWNSRVEITEENEHYIPENAFNHLQREKQRVQVGVVSGFFYKFDEKLLLEIADRCTDKIILVVNTEKEQIDKFGFIIESTKSIIKKLQNFCDFNLFIDYQIIDKGPDIESTVELIEFNEKKNTDVEYFGELPIPTNTIRDWGTFDVLSIGRKKAKKLLYIQPNKATSFQKHIHRTETWEVLSGSILILLENEKKRLLKGESYTIEENTPHQLVNDSNEIVVIEENWFSKDSVLSEDDIIRL